MIERIPFGSTGHASTRVLFGAAALGGMRQERADAVLEQVVAAGVNHIDTAASYGDSELRLAPFLKRHRARFFLATKTGQRAATAARDELHRSLERLGVERVDLIQLHNLVDEQEWATALGPGGALESLIQARDEGLVRFIGVTGHGTQAPAVHLKSLGRFPFASVLAPYNCSMMAQPDYARDFEQLHRVCREREVALQTIKSVARRRWRPDDADKHFSWYMPITDRDAIRRAVHYVLARPGVFLNSSSDATLLPVILEAASLRVEPPSDEEMARDVAALGIEPLFGRGSSDTI
jgi:aryl-alcohol dehydrogenase-like predicted oxidoreductase